MNLQNTVSKILGREVTEVEAMTFARDQFGLLATWLRENDSVVAETVANEVWRSGVAINLEKNKIKREAKKDMQRLVANGLSAVFSRGNSDFDQSKFIADCGV